MVGKTGALLGPQGPLSALSGPRRGSFSAARAVPVPNFDSPTCDAQCCWSSGLRALQNYAVA
eukprot:482119-Pyramimonas_sp.AAC.1